MRAGVYPALASRFDFWPVATAVGQGAVIGLAFDPDERPSAPDTLVDIVGSVLALALDRQHFRVSRDRWAQEVEPNSNLAPKIFIRFRRGVRSSLRRGQKSENGPPQQRAGIVRFRTKAGTAAHFAMTHKTVALTSMNMVSCRLRRKDTLMKRRQFITLLCGVAAAWSLTAHAQQPKPLPKVGWFEIQGRQHTPGQLQAFREGMRALGLVEGRNYEIEERYADGDEARLPNLTTRTPQGGRQRHFGYQPAVDHCRRTRHKTVPIIGRMVDDPVADGMAQSLARPAGNVTGIYTMTEELNPKRLSLLKEAVPSVAPRWRLAAT